MPATSTVTSLSPRRPDSYITPPSHHVGTPPSSFKNPWSSYGFQGVTGLLKKRWNTPKNFVPVPGDRAGLVEVRKPDFGEAFWSKHGKHKARVEASRGRCRMLPVKQNGNLTFFCPLRVKDVMVGLGLHSIEAGELLGTSMEHFGVAGS
ncbi:hypothetical protein P280DRAFT_554196 [Massarina eburnea CBS 473.64]|uniref:Uncharacterized protein n=1 Tax=Massarina eburnea CBS 473.64 TaxID=1395130 RepID=A0A6A6RIP6_9PLEO|nr:hypothetical protein P280DRAFT_554196 [Massarina eburnea CBS 473.64]